MPLIVDPRVNEDVEEDDEVADDVNSCHVPFLNSFEIKTKCILDISGKRNYEF
jgi:hypothetical protein